MPAAASDRPAAWPAALCVLQVAAATSFQNLLCHQLAADDVLQRESGLAVALLLICDQAACLQALSCSQPAWHIFKYVETALKALHGQRVN